MKLPPPPSTFLGIICLFALCFCQLCLLAYLYILYFCLFVFVFMGVVCLFACVIVCFFICLFVGYLCLVVQDILMYMSTGQSAHLLQTALKF